LILKLNIYLINQIKMEKCLRCNVNNVEKYKYCKDCFIAYRRYLKHKNDELQFLPDSDDEE